MARDVIVTVKMTRNQGLNLGSLAAPANGAAFTQANGQSFTIKKSHRFGLLVYNSKAGVIVVTIKAGTNPPAEDSGLGDLTVTVPTTAFFTLIGPLDGSRFATVAAGVASILVDTDAGATGTMWAVEFPN